MSDISRVVFPVSFEDCLMGADGGTGWPMAALVVTGGVAMPGDGMAVHAAAATGAMGGGT